MPKSSLSEVSNELTQNLKEEDARGFLQYVIRFFVEVERRQQFLRPEDIGFALEIMCDHYDEWLEYKVELSQSHDVPSNVVRLKPSQK